MGERVDVRAKGTFVCRGECEAAIAQAVRNHSVGIGDAARNHEDRDVRQCGSCAQVVDKADGRSARHITLGHDQFKLTFCAAEASSFEQGDCGV